MKFSIGDKVSFLNEKRNGIIVAILTNKMVKVAIDDGFELPIQESELVKINFTGGDTRKEKYQPKNIEIVSEPKKLVEENNLIALKLKDNDKKEENIFIAYVPENNINPASGKISVWLINRTEQDIIFTYSLKQSGEYIFIDYDKINADTASLLKKISMSELEEWSHISIKILFFNEGGTDSKLPETKEFIIKPLKLLKEDNYKYFSILNKNAVFVPLRENKKEAIEWKEEKWKNSKINKFGGIKIVGHIDDLKKKIAPFPPKHIIEKGIAEVDLHIDELLDNLSGLSNKEYLNIQIKYFLNMLESAIANHFTKIIFIHGIGNGRLKSEITTKLKTDYSNYTFYDASMARYGVGATEVKLK